MIWIKRARVENTQGLRASRTVERRPAPAIERDIAPVETVDAADDEDRSSTHNRALLVALLSARARGGVSAPRSPDDRYYTAGNSTRQAGPTRPILLQPGLRRINGSDRDIAVNWA
jgi:hypothetical protein